jgi:type III secretion protein J
MLQRAALASGETFPSRGKLCAKRLLRAAHREGGATRPLIAILFGLLLLLAGCSNRVELFSSATDEEANEILSVLLQSSIPAEKQVKKAGVAISVAEADVARALDMLRQHGLPRERFEGMGKIFHKEGMISSPLEERARYIYALSQELENTLTKMDGVLVARVHIVLPDQDASRVAKTPASAAVFIKHQAGYNLDLLKPQIRTLVAHAIPELGEDRVSVVLVAAQRPYQSMALAAPVPMPPSGQGASAGQGAGGWGAINRWTALVAAVACVLGGLGLRAWLRRRGSASHAGAPERDEAYEGIGPG